jgi:hypothetical protein
MPNASAAPEKPLSTLPVYTFAFTWVTAVLSLAVWIGLGK